MRIFYWFIYSFTRPSYRLLISSLPDSNKTYLQGKQNIVESRLGCEDWDFTREIIGKEASADDSLELKFIQVKHLRDIGLQTHAEMYY